MIYVLELSDIPVGIRRSCLRGCVKEQEATPRLSATFSFTPLETALLINASLRLN